MDIYSLGYEGVVDMVKWSSLFLDLECEVVVYMMYVS